MSGALLGLALLTRGHLLPVVPALVLAAVVWRSRLQRDAGRLIAVALCAVLPIAMWSLRNCLQVGSLSLSTQSGNAFWLGNNGDARGSWPGNWRSSPELGRLLHAHPELIGAPEPVKSDIYTQAAIAGIRTRGIRHFVYD